MTIGGASRSHSFFLVGLGCSAGGTEALIEFFSHLGSTPHGAYVVIQHRSPEAEQDGLAAVLRRSAAMPVQWIESGLEIKPGQIYLCTPRTQVQLQDRIFQCVDADDPARVITPAFQSLSRWGKQAIGILMSGVGRDGIEGLQQISQRGGSALVQSPETAQFSTLPAQAIASDQVDQILSIPELAQTVALLTQSPAQTLETSDTGMIRVPQEHLQQILEILNHRSSTQFFSYKPGTLSRRILHRCNSSGASSLEDYIRILGSSEGEQEELRRDLLIGSTQFFRDPQAWQVLATEVLPELIGSLPEQQMVRMWVSACSTGEEAYSLAILVYETVQHLGRSNPVKIFATDLNSESLETVSQGIYPADIAHQLTPERLNQHFLRKQDHYQVRSHLREMLIVAPHDLTQNAAFSNMHLVSCRNLLIYMQPQLQDQVLRILHFSLVPKGILFLGSSESLANLSSEFEPIETKWKIFRKLRDLYLPIHSAIPQPNYTPTPVSNRPQYRQPQFERLLGEIYETCFADQALTCCVVDANNQLLHLYADSAQILELPLGNLRADITDLVPMELKLPLGTALHRSRREDQLVYYSNIGISTGQQERIVNLKVRPLPYMNGERYFIVVIESLVTQQEATDPPLELDTDTLRQISELEFELQQTRENLQVTREELSTSNEEQQAINEELLASNEELQSTNEELQSVNEELQTLNADHEIKIRELTQLNSDIDNLLRSTQIGVLFLDDHLKIRKFTPATTRAINVIPTDTNRPLTHLTHNLDCPDLIELIQQVLTSGKSIERKVEVRQTGDALLMRINPYLSSAGNREGVVIIFIDINELHQAQLQLQQTHRLLENLFERSPVGLSLHDGDLRFLRINQVLAEINGFPVEYHIGKRGPDLIPEIEDQIEPLMRQVIDTRIPISNFEIKGTTPAVPDKERYWLASYFPIEMTDGSYGVGAAITEITELKEAEISLRNSEERLEQLNRLKDDFLSTVSHELRSPLSNMRMALHMMSLAESEDKRQSYYTVAFRECERQIEMVNDLLDLQRLEADAYQLQIEPLDLNQHLEQLLESFEFKLESRLYTKTLDLPEQPFHTDRGCFHRIVNELLHNASK